MVGNTPTLLRLLMFTLTRQGFEIIWHDVISDGTFSHIHTELD